MFVSIFQQQLISFFYCILTLIQTDIDDCRNAILKTCENPNIYKYIFFEFQMKRNNKMDNFVDKILQDKKIQQQWQMKDKTQDSDNLSEQQDDKQKEEYSVRNKINNLLHLKHKKIEKNDDAVSLLEAQLKKKGTEIVALKNHCAELNQENLKCKKQVFDVYAAMREMYNFAKKDFAKIFEDSRFSTLQVEKQNPINIAKEVTKILYALSELQGEKSRLYQDIQKLVTDNAALTKTNQRLLTHIQQRKAYSESLKQKISRQKQQIQKLQQQLNSIKTNEVILLPLEQKLDIKYMNRNDLITLSKSLIQKIRKHAKQCKNQTNKIELQDIEKFLPKDLAQIVKRHDSRNKSGKNKTKERDAILKGSKQKSYN